MDGSITATLALGFVLGLRHALDADHVAAVTSMVSEQRSVARSAWLGTFWGAGHTAALLAAAVAMIAFKLTISPRVEQWLEGAVAVVLIALGAHVLRRTRGAIAVHRHTHSHDGHRHSHVHVHVAEGHPGGHAHGHVHLLRLGRRPFLVGVLHGLAGSATLTLLVLATIPSPAAAVLYVLVFGVGSTAGMLLVSGLIGLPVALAAGSRTAPLVIQAVAGAASVTLGGWLLISLPLN
jgi:high-affinity nickel permease